LVDLRREASVEHFARAAAKEFAPRGISVNNVAPGPMDSPLLYPAETADSGWATVVLSSARHVRSDLARSPGLGGMSGPGRNDEEERRDRVQDERRVVQPDHAVGGMTGECQNVVVVHPELADDDEADQPAEELREQREQLMAEVADAALIGE